MSIADYSFEERLARAATLPSRWYTDPEILALEKQKIFGRAWQLVGRAEQVARPGDYVTSSVADEPIILRSRTYTMGRYSVKRENGVHHFHGLLLEFLSRQ